jgi:hypothetical protein
LVFGSNGLVFGERLVHTDDVAWFLSFGARLEGGLDQAMLASVRTGLAEVRKMGLPDEIADLGCGWSLGS